MRQLGLTAGVDQQSEDVPGQPVIFELFLDGVDDPVMLDAELERRAGLAMTLARLGDRDEAGRLAARARDRVEATWPNGPLFLAYAEEAALS